MSVAMLRQMENASLSFCSWRHFKKSRLDATCQEAHTLTSFTSVAGGVMLKNDLAGDVIPLETSGHCCPHRAKVLSFKQMSLRGYSGLCQVIHRNKTTKTDRNS